MTIAEQDIRFRQSQVMDDVPEGGGAITGNDIVDGQMNNVFPDVSDLDRVYGSLRMRKIGVAVQSLNTDLFGGAKTVITDLPGDGSISYMLFQTGEPFDTRFEAAARVQAYMYKAVAWPGFLFGNHISGQGMIQIFQRPNTALPQPGQTLALVYNEGLPLQREQYVRIARVKGEERLFFDASSKTDYSALVVTCEMSGTLGYDFPGSDPDRSFKAQDNKTVVRTTNVVDAARYFGAAKLTASASVGDNAAQVASIMTALVPAAQSEANVVDVQAAGVSTDTVSGGARDVAVSQVSHTNMMMVTELNAGHNFVFLLRPIPAPGTLVVHFRSQGQRYELRDLTGDGTLTGPGSGRVDYASGSLQITTLEIPDVGTGLVYQWGSGVHYEIGSSAEVIRPGWTFRLQRTGIEPGTVVITWPGDGGMKTVTDDGQGNLTGDGVGRISYTLAQIYLEPTELPRPTVTPQITYSYGALEHEDFTPAKDGNGFVTVQIANAPVRPRSVLVEWETVRPRTDAEKS